MPEDTLFADLIVANARVHTLDSRQPTAESLAVSGGLLMAVGRTTDVEGLAGPNTRVADLGGRTVIPGIIDSHLHLLSFGMRLFRTDLQGVPSLEVALAAVRESTERAAAGEWVLGGGWDRNLWGRLPTRWDLDPVAPRHPVLLSSKDGHAQWANSLALERAGITPETPDPPGGEIVRDPATGQPTGLLLENAAEMILRAVPSPSPERCEAALSQALAIAAGKGLSGVQTFEDQRTFSALQRLRARGALPLRVCCHLWREALPHAERLGLRTGFGDEWLRLGHLKLFLDGALGSQTAHMLEPYSHKPSPQPSPRGRGRYSPFPRREGGRGVRSSLSPFPLREGGRGVRCSQPSPEGRGSRGIATMSRDEFRDLVVAAAEAGIAVAVHAIGDAANRIALDVFEETASLWRPAGLRPRIEHVQLLHPDDAERPGKIGVVASMQPIHATSDWEIAERYWAGRTSLAYAWRTILDSGAVLAFGSDCPVEPIDPLLGLYAAVTRRRADGQPRGGWHSEQRLTPLEALRAYTLGAAYSTGEENLKGSLAPGKLADFVVLSEDPFGAEAATAGHGSAEGAEAFLQARVEATVVGGRVVHGGL